MIQGNFMKIAERIYQAMTALPAMTATINQAQDNITVSLNPHAPINDTYYQLDFWVECEEPDDLEISTTCIAEWAHESATIDDQDYFIVNGFLAQSLRANRTFPEPLLPQAILVENTLEKAIAEHKGIKLTNGFNNLDPQDQTLILQQLTATLAMSDHDKDYYFTEAKQFREESLSDFYYYHLPKWKANTPDSKLEIYKAMVLANI